MALGGALGSGLGAPWSRVTPRHCAWQAWHLVTSTFVSRGRRGTISHPQAFCVAGVAPTIVLCGRRGTHGTGWRAWVWFRRALVGVTPRHCAWQAWHLVTSTFVSRGRRGTISHPQAFCVAGVAQSHIHHRFAWQAWHNLTSTIVLCGRRGTGWRAWVWFRRALVARDAAALCAAGVALGDIHFRFTWQARHNLTSTSVLRGRRGTHHRFVWQAWHSWHWVARLGLV